MLSFQSDAEEHLIVVPLLVWELELLLLPSVGHFRKTNDIWEDLHLYNVVLMEFET